ncbi:zinc finger protein 668 [Anabrus simplex]|uniref:zinc finger protein 668 n=1 Tax=Anabrus simplex TaxID=316456 RepID=UPI0035A27173
MDCVSEDAVSRTCGFQKNENSDEIYEGDTICKETSAILANKAELAREVYNHSYSCSAQDSNITATEDTYIKSGLLSLTLTGTMLVEERIIVGGNSDVPNTLSEAIKLADKSVDSPPLSEKYILPTESEISDNIGGSEGNNEKKESLVLPPELASAALRKEPINVWVVQTIPCEESSLETTFTSLKIIPLALGEPTSMWPWEMPPEPTEEPTYTTLKTVPLNWEDQPLLDSNGCSWSSSFSDDEEVSTMEERSLRNDTSFNTTCSELGVHSSSSDGDLKRELKEEIVPEDHILDLSDDPAEEDSYCFDCSRHSDINSRSSFDENLCQKNDPDPIPAGLPDRVRRDLYVCSLCNKHFNDQLVFKYHKRMHKSRKPYICDHCNQKFAREKTLERHKLTHAVPLPEQRLGCPVCGEGFSQKTLLKAHLKKEHASKDKSCRECGQCFKTRRSLELHTVMVHQGNGAGAFVCDICGKRFALEIRLKYHQVMHYERQYRCNICAVTLATKHSLRRHLFIHSGKKPFVCEVCGKAFAFELYLRNHCKKHLQPLVCEICNKTFQSREELDAHAALPHNKLFPPKVCETSKEVEPPCVSIKNVGRKAEKNMPPVKPHSVQANGVSVKRRSLQANSVSVKRRSVKANGVSVKQRAVKKNGESVKPRSSKLNSESVKPRAMKLNSESSPRKKPPMPYKCDYCRRAFETQIELDGHIAEALHNETGPFLCPICDKTFKVLV